jgi:hypothetical protein
LSRRLYHASRQQTKHNTNNQQQTSFRSSQIYILISSDGHLLLRDADAFNGFCIVEVADCGPFGSAGKALEKVALAVEDNHYWIDIDVIIALYEGDNPTNWSVMFWVMLDSSEPDGYFNRTTNRVKAHVETQLK